jgi:phosphate transport system protein
MPPTRSRFDKELENLHQKILKMGSIVEQQIFDAVQSLVKQDENLANKVIDEDDKVDKLQLEIEDMCVKLIARQHPMAKDLREIFTGIKLVTDLERMSDRAVDIARITLRLLNQKYIKPLIDIPRMAEITQNMVKVALDSYVKHDVDLARSLYHDEEKVDNLYSQIFRELLVFMIEDPKKISQATHLLFVGRHLERVADHATNIGEMTIYLVTGKRENLNE